jgi:hypothetical protein
MDDLGVLGEVRDPDRKEQVLALDAVGTAVAMASSEA